MANDTTILYKLMILFMLNRVDFPLSYSQISDFMLDEYTSYFLLTESLNGLTEAGYIVQSHTYNSTQYRITSLGKETLELFKDQISQTIRNEISDFLIKNKCKLRDESNITSNYFKTTSNDYSVQCLIREGKEDLLEIQLSIPDEDMANQMCSNWSEASQDIYEYICKRLLQKKADA